MKWPLAKLYRGNAAAAATPHQSGQARQLLLKEKPFGGRIFLHYKKVHSPSSVSLYARHLLPFGRRLLSLCALQETWLFLPTTALNHARFLHPTMPPWHADAIGAGWQCHPQFYSSSFYVTNRFFVSFLVRPALLPCGKRGFRAAIYKIARPQPPAAAL